MGAVLGSFLAFLRKRRLGRLLGNTPLLWVSLIKAQMMEPLTLGTALWVIVQRPLGIGTTPLTMGSRAFSPGHSTLGVIELLVWVGHSTFGHGLQQE